MDVILTGNEGGWEVENNGLGQGHDSFVVGKVVGGIVEVVGEIVEEVVRLIEYEGGSRVEDENLDESFVVGQVEVRVVEEGVRSIEHAGGSGVEKGKLGQGPEPLVRGKI